MGEGVVERIGDGSGYLESGLVLVIGRGGGTAELNMTIPIIIWLITSGKSYCGSEDTRLDWSCLDEFDSPACVLDRVDTGGDEAS